MKFLLLIIGLTFYLPSFSQSTSSLKGKVTDKDTNEGIPFTNIKLSLDGVFVAGAVTDMDGYYQFHSLEPGYYTLECSYAGYVNSTIKDILVTTGQTTHYSLTIKEWNDAVILPVLPPTDEPIFEPGHSISGQIINRERIAKYPGNY